MTREHNLAAIVVFITLIEGLAIDINIVAYLDVQPVLTAIIAVLTAVASGLAVWYLSKPKILV